ncbi:MAG: hypothetical protein ACWGIK_00635 [Achromobacter pulmonis]|uniref:hypothetical protein n=1 Tax=Achromobacter pulmonis TaxID=1389932 RepID=UPI001466B2FD|nr:hypothetical protein [Achromobacter pulmonis]CAB3665484.1 hypothetical protein LMG26696_03597 [Achromobacter pulmonis]
MTPEQLEAIAQRPTCCKTYGETVSLTKDERDALVDICRLVVEKFTSGNSVPVERITIRADELAKEQ